MVRNERMASTFKHQKYDQSYLVVPRRVVMKLCHRHEKERHLQINKLMDKVGDTVV